MATVERLADDRGFEPFVAGGLDRAGHLEALARFWMSQSRSLGQEFGFALFRREGADGGELRR